MIKKEVILKVTLVGIFKKILRWLGIILLVLLLGGIGSILMDRSILPYLAARPGLANLDTFKRATDNVTIINRTEEVVIREDDTVERIASQPATAVVNIVVLGGVRETGLADESVPSSRVSTVTGVLLTNDGLVVTYNDRGLGDPEARYVILLFDGRSYEADFIGHDNYAHLDFFRLRERPNTPAIALANSDDTRVGRRLIVIGNTFAEYQNRLEVGLLNNIDRVFNLAGKTVASSEKLEGVFEMSLEDPEKYVGGPVIGFNGEMIGLVGALEIDNETEPFLVPSNTVRQSLDRVLAGRLSERAYLGAYYLPITKAYALGQNLSRDRGALIYSPSGQRGLAIIANSPADRAGLQVGDIITAVNGREINLENPLSELLSAFNRGDRVDLLILRNGSEQTLPITL